jgi:sarcosine oxidase subunit gamma
MADLAALDGPGVALRPLPERARFVLRCVPEVLAEVAAAFGVRPPEAPLASAVAGDRAALWLGPDEWLLLAEAKAAPPSLAGPASLVDVSHRPRGFALAGPQAALLLNEGCPLDLDLAAFPAGACTRTLFGKVEILLWRTGAETFEVEVARSFAAPWHALVGAAMADLDPPLAAG